MDSSIARALNLAPATICHCSLYAWAVHHSTTSWPSVVVPTISVTGNAPAFAQSVTRDAAVSTLGPSALRGPRTIACLLGTTRTASTTLLSFLYAIRGTKRSSQATPAGPRNKLGFVRIGGRRSVPLVDVTVLRPSRANDNAIPCVTETWGARLWQALNVMITGLSIA